MSILIKTIMFINFSLRVIDTRILHLCVSAYAWRTETHPTRIASGDELLSESKKIFDTDVCLVNSIIKISCY